MELTSLTGPAPQAPSTQNAAVSAQTDFETFLKLLTAQMRNQDPLEPLDSTAFVAQLASFSSVEQQIGTNTRLDALAAAIGGSDHAIAANWIGKSARAEGPVDFVGSPVDVTFSTPSGEQTTISVLDTNGTQIYIAPLLSGSKEYTWAGQTTAGPIATKGSYIIERKQTLDDGTTRLDRAQHFQLITEVRFDPQGTRLITHTGETVALEDVSALRTAP